MFPHFYVNNPHVDPTKINIQDKIVNYFITFSNN